MSVKQDVLTKLEHSRGQFFSGEELARELDVSRTAVWKAIKQLEVEGYEIHAVPNKGYCLSLNTDVISTEGIRASLLKEWKDCAITTYKETGSTNQNAKLAAAEGAEHGSLFVAEAQTNGRGRRGRVFETPKGNGIYMSILLKPQMEAADAIYMTTAASVAVRRAIKKVTGKETLIKWVNDLYFEEKKVCGILTEAVTDIQTGMVDSIILGIGINFNMPEDAFSEEIKHVAGSLYHGENVEVTRNQLVAEIFNQVMELCMNKDDRSFIEEYKKYSFILGEEIVILSADGNIPAKAVDITDFGGLVVELLDGTRKTISSGEVSIRKQSMVKDKNA
ncbi:MAG: biotin--[acetyl-CoA-carboxylase] ligase [Lachnospiraceae bacterium]|nr:biotin--[acetyl-CoA-carboxylase] ligase [Lachnospiraceae bacterium]